MELKKAGTEEFKRITGFYRCVSENTQNMESFGRWIYGKHPTDGMIKSYMEDGCMYYAEKNGVIAAAAAVTFFQEADYHPVQWNIPLNDDEVAVIHILCVNPKMQKKGLAKAVVREIIRLAEENQKKAVRLDALCSNKPAHKLYESLGFKKCGVQNWYAGNTGQTDFCLFEYVCS